MKKNDEDLSFKIEIEEMVLEIVGDHYGIPGISLSKEIKIQEDLGADVIDKTELIMTIEELFEIRIKKDFSKIKTVCDIIDSVMKSNINYRNFEQIKKYFRLSTRSSFARKTEE